MADEMPAAEVTATETLAQTGFSRLIRSQVRYRRGDGRIQAFAREAYDHGDGVAILLHDPARDRVLLVRQWRFGAHVNPRRGVHANEQGCLIEVPAGLLDGRDPVEAVRAEAMEEVGVRVADPVAVATCYMSPGSLTERVTLFACAYVAADRVAGGGGVADEGEDIQIIEPTLGQALAMIRSGEICDAKTVILLQHLALKRSGWT